MVAGEGRRPAASSTDGTVVRPPRNRTADVGAALPGLELVRGRCARDPLDAGRDAKAALAIARRLGDPDLEITALGRLGLAELRVGAVQSGMPRLDEAMAGALGGEAAALETLGELCCDLISAVIRPATSTACASGTACSTRPRASAASCR
jgi:hypothetical protein